MNMKIIQELDSSRDFGISMEPAWVLVRVLHNFEKLSVFYSSILMFINYGYSIAAEKLLPLIIQGNNLFLYVTCKQRSHL